MTVPDPSRSHHSDATVTPQRATAATADHDGRWMTYAELADIRGISKASAERLARRLKWRRQPGNDRQARVLVPPDAMGIPNRGGSIPNPDKPPDIDALRRSFDTALETVNAALEAVRVRAERAEERAERLAEELRLLRQAEAAGKGRGRWARLRDAWRG